MRVVLLVAAVAALFAVAFSCPAATEPVYRQDQKSAASSQEEKRDHAATSAYALHREAAITKAQTTDDFRGARKALAAVMADPLFPTLTASEQRDVLSSAAWVEVRSGDYEASAPYYRRAVQLDPSDPDDWHRLSMAEDTLGNYEAAVDALIRIPREWPHLTDALSAGHVLGLVDHLPADSEKRLALMQTLLDANWKREEESASDLWHELALTLVERGEKERAREVIARIVWPGALMTMQADRRFDLLLPSEPEFVTESLHELIDRLEALSHDNPRNLYTHNEWLEALLHAGRHEDVIAISAEILAKIAAETPEQPAYHDSDDENFTQEIRAHALHRAGRLEEAEATLKRASELTEYGEPNIDQKLSLAAWYNDRLRPDEAIATIANLAMAEQYSRTEREVIMMQAALINGDERRVEQSLERIRAHVEDAESLVTQALLRASRLDDAAALFVRRLQDPRLRGGALLVAQHNLESEPLPGDATYRHNRQVLLERPDVKAAIDAVGRVQSYDVW